MDRTAIQPPPVMYYDDFHFPRGKVEWSKTTFGCARRHISPDKKELITVIYLYTQNTENIIPSCINFYKRDGNNKRWKCRRDGRPCQLSFDTETAQLIGRKYYTEEGFMEIRE